MNRRDFLSHLTKTTVGAAFALSVLPKLTPPIGWILDFTKNKKTDGEYFFAHSQSQEDALYEAARAVARDGHQIYFERNEYRPPRWGTDGVLVFPSHGGGIESVPLVKFCCAILLPDTIGHRAFDIIRSKAERW